MSSLSDIGRQNGKRKVAYVLRKHGRDSGKRGDGVKAQRASGSRKNAGIGSWGEMGETEGGALSKKEYHENQSKGGHGGAV